MISAVGRTCVVRTSLGCAAALAIAVGCGVFAQSVPRGPPRRPPSGRPTATMPAACASRRSPSSPLRTSSRLEVAWVYHMKPATAASRALQLQRSHAARRQRDDVSRRRRTIASWPWMRRPARRSWVYQLPSGNPSTRGVEYWPGDAQTPPQIVFGSSDGKLYSLDAKTGKPNEAFGDKGVVNLDTPEIMQGLPGSNGLSSPPIVYKNLVITGGTTQENPPRGPAGDVRAWDMRTGKLVWTFRSVPRAGEKFNDTWARRQLEEPLGRQRLGLHDGGRRARHRLHAVRRAVGRSVRRRPRGRQPVRHAAWSRPTRTPASTCGTSRSCITTSGTPISPARRR